MTGTPPDEIPQNASNRPFYWGASTAAFQIEGAAAEGGRTASIWDTFSAAPGNIQGGDDPSRACDHYHRWPEDVQIMGDMGLTAYRLSVSWTRLFPDTTSAGIGDPNPAGLAFYRDLLAALRGRGIEPFVTLYHWDLPETLQQGDGWATRRTAELFADYAAATTRLLGDLVTWWFTVNEPACIVWSGYWDGGGAPGVRDAATALAAAHHVNLAHGLGAAAIRSANAGAKVSFAPNPQRIRPATDSPEDVEAAADLRAMTNEIFLDPCLAGRLPERILRLTEHVSDWSFVRDGDLVAAHQPLDAVGVNYYCPGVVRRGRAHGTPPPGCEHVESVELPGPRTDMGWPIDASGLTELLRELDTTYPGNRWMVTENGIACSAPAGQDPRNVHDRERIDYLRDHIDATLAARRAGVAVDGYFSWSLLDNFEWRQGYAPRFGMIHVDYATLERTPRDSAWWYSERISAGVS